MLDKVIAGKNAIRISGPKAILAHQVTADKTPAAVPGVQFCIRMARHDCPRSDNITL